MAKFSPEARRLAAAAKALGLLPPEPPSLTKAHAHDLPTHIPLGRKRDIELAGMTDDELATALEQCRARVERTKESDPNLERYSLMLQAAEAESNRRSKTMATLEIVDANDDVVATNDIDTTEVGTVELPDLAVPVVPEDTFEEDEPPKERFGHHPLDTPDSDSLIPKWG